MRPLPSHTQQASGSLPPQAGQFIRPSARLLPASLGALPYFLASYDTALYSPALFDACLVEFPIQLRNSVAKRQAEFLAGRLCARLALQDAGCGHSLVAIGKQREPLWPSGYLGSITHSVRFAAALACLTQQARGIGIDIETIIDASARPALASLVVCAEELDLLRRHAGLPFDCLLTLVFSAKESFYKAAYAQVQAFFDHDAVRLVAIDEQRAVLRFRCTRKLSTGLPEGMVVEAHFEAIEADSVLTAVLLRT